MSNKTVNLIVLMLLQITLAKSQTKLWGMAQGGTGGGGIFTLDENGENPEFVYNFPYKAGNTPKGELCEANNGKLYGLASGASNQAGWIFEFDPINNTYTVKVKLNDNLGVSPDGGLVKAGNGKLYGLGKWGGQYDFGTIFEYDPVSNECVLKHSFDEINGEKPRGCTMIEGRPGKLYGTTEFGSTGFYNKGVLFEFDYVTNEFKKLTSFGGERGHYPRADLVLGNDGKLYGTVEQVGLYGNGVIYSYDLDSSVLEVCHHFKDETGGKPISGLTIHPNGLMYGVTYGGHFIYSFDPTDKTFEVVGEIDTIGGIRPICNLEVLKDGTMIGTASDGGSNSEGIIFKFDPVHKTIIKLYDFGGLKGEAPFAGLMTTSSGRMFGLTDKGGAEDKGVLYEYLPEKDSVTTLYHFDYKADGWKAEYGFLKAKNGKLYGTTTEGGLYDQGTLFEFDPVSEQYRKIVDFYHSLGNGSGNVLPLMQASDGHIYGVDYIINSRGLIFKYSIENDQYDVLHNFDYNQIYWPKSQLIEYDGHLYGIGQRHTNNYEGGIFKYNLNDSTVTPVIYFSDAVTGRIPGAHFVLEGDKLYGTTTSGGPGLYGVIFEFDLKTEEYIVKHSFNKQNGSNAEYGLMKASNEKLYGCTSSGGEFGRGIFYEYDLASDSFRIITSFDYTSNGSLPRTRLVELNGTLFGTSSLGGENYKGVVFSYDLTSDAFNTTIQCGEENIIENVYGGLTVLNQNVTNIKPGLIDQELLIYPNPALNYIKNPSNKEISFFNIQGKLLLISSEDEIDISSFPAGIYLANCKNKTVKLEVIK